MATSGRGEGPLMCYVVISPSDPLSTVPKSALGRLVATLEASLAVAREETCPQITSASKKETHSCSTSLSVMGFKAWLSYPPCSKTPSP